MSTKRQLLIIVKKVSIIKSVFNSTSKRNNESANKSENDEEFACRVEHGQWTAVFSR